MSNNQPFDFSPSVWVPFKDKGVICRILSIKREDLEKHGNPDFKIKIVPDGDMDFIWITDMYARIKRASETGQQLVMILPNPAPLYKNVARLLNATNVDCRNLHVFAMDEYADENGNIAPESWEFGFTHAMMKYFYYELDEKLRPDKKQFVGLSNENIHDYSQMIADLGGADICYSGPGWTGHLAFIEPDAPEFQGTLEEWKQMGARICTLSPFTLAQNSLHGCFGKSGNLAAVPPKAATIGPLDVIRAKERIDFHGITVAGTTTSWQRFTTRLVLHGPVTPLVPESILQTLPTQVYVSENIAQNIETDWNRGY
jgi:6-phosphogluconolactonase/Glucosamine-6-phosphate isomerase/deaminase